MYLLITYDIADTKKRTKLSDLLEKHGVRVNYSVFELDISAKKLNGLIEEMRRYTDKQDSLRIYRFNKETIAKSYEILCGSAPFEKESGYVD